MAIYRITPATSIAGNAFYAFNEDTPFADSLIIDPEAYVLSTGGGGAFLAATGAWTVTINGSLIGGHGTGLVLAGTSATITIGVDGSVSGSGSALALYASATLNNAGEIVSGGYGVLLQNAGIHTLKNSGVIRTTDIDGYVIRDYDGLSSKRLTNSGTLQGIVDVYGGNDTLVNSVSITNLVSLGGGNDLVNNSGSIAAVVDLAGGNDTMTNSGNITGEVILGVGGTAN